MRKLLPLAALVLTCTLTQGAWAQSAPVAKDGRTVNEIATYQGADREKRLLEGARKEGEVSVYYAHPIVQDLMAAFTKKYGIKTRSWRGGSEAMQQRLTAEQRAGRHDVDIFLTTSSDTELFAREKVLQEIRSPQHQDLMPGSVPAHRQWATFNLDIFVAAYNTKLVKKEDLPKTYNDLTDPKWKGKLAVEANDHVWFGALMGEMGEAATRKLFDSIIATNGISVRKGHSLLAGMVASGEVPLALTVYTWNSETLKRKGAPVETLLLQPLYGYPAGIAMPVRAPNPNAAVLFYDFVLGEGQKIMADAGYIGSSKRVPTMLGNLGAKLIDVPTILRDQDKWFKAYEEVFVKRAR